ncbi:MAG: hypothetical protein CL915_04085 [Deltaproteobacteria bacterium]|nr:hypothetical protein [Deltaproteobacteria bacterium]
MANALVGKASVSITCVAPNNTAAKALRDFFVGHREFMEEKSYQNGPLSMVHYSISESPEYERDDAAWAQGKGVGAVASFRQMKESPRFGELAMQCPHCAHPD